DHQWPEAACRAAPPRDHARGDIGNRDPLHQEDPAWIRAVRCQREDQRGARCGDGEHGGYGHERPRTSPLGARELRRHCRRHRLAYLPAGASLPTLARFHCESEVRPVTRTPGHVSAALSLAARTATLTT